MTIDEEKLFPLERLLKVASREHRQAFPSVQENYFDRYSNVKDWLERNVYKHIGAGLSQDGGIFTSHGADHFDEVIRYAGFMIGAEEPDCVPDKLKPYETYVLLTAILLHDAGNLFGREQHEKRPFELLLEMGDISGSDNIEKKAIAEVAEAHGAYTASGEKDTIRNLPKKRHHGPVFFRGQLLAGILRFADEICEHRGREVEILLRFDQMPKISEVFHVYARSISSLTVDMQGNTVNIVYDIPLVDIVRLWGKDDTEVYLTDEVMTRLEKMNLERIYCNRFMQPLFVADRIRASIQILNDKYQCEKKISILIEDSGYPTSGEKLADRYPELKGANLHQQFAKKNKD